MEVTAMQNNKGFSIISVLVAMVIFLVAMLGLLSGIIYSRHLSTRNLLRNEAIRIVQETFDSYRNDNYTKITNDFDHTSASTTCSNCLDNSSLSGCHTVSKQINNTNVTFGMLFNGSPGSGGITFDNITVCWKYLDVLYEKKFATIILK